MKAFVFNYKFGGSQRRAVAVANDYDFAVALVARELLRRYEELGMPSDRVRRRVYQEVKAVKRGKVIVHSDPVGLAKCISHNLQDAMVKSNEYHRQGAPRS